MAMIIGNIKNKQEDIFELINQERNTPNNEILISTKMTHAMIIVYHLMILRLSCLKVESNAA